MTWRGRKLAFTIIELLIVIAIIATLITIITVSFGPSQRKTRDAKRKSDISQMAASVKLFESDFKILPNYTFYLGRNTGDVGATNSNYDLANDIANCSSLTDGHPNNFVANTNFTTAGPLPDPGVASTYDPLILKPGYASLNHFLICLKYAERLFVDPNFTGIGGYHYRASYDYAEFLVGTQMENTADATGLSVLFTGGGNNGETINPKRFFEGNGRSARQLDDDSNISGDIYTFTANGGSAGDGKYFYQCAKDAGGTALTRDARSDTAKAPIITDSSGNWVPNSSGCQSPVDNANDVAVAAY